MGSSLPPTPPARSSLLPACSTDVQLEETRQKLEEVEAVRQQATEEAQSSLDGALRGSGVESVFERAWLAECAELCS